MYRVGGLLIKNKKLLIVTGESHPKWWSPGGRIDKGEDPEVALRRELQEELTIKSGKYTYYKTLKSHHSEAGMVKDFGYFLVETTDEIIPRDEISSIAWVSYSDAQDGKVEVTPGVQQVMEELVKDGLL